MADRPTNDYPWWTEHLLAADAILLAGAAAGGLAGTGVSWGCVSQHLLSPGNILAGWMFGLGGVLAGLLAAWLIIEATGRRWRV